MPAYRCGPRCREILAGVLDKVPDLTLICGHWGELLPYYLDRMNDMMSPASTGLELTIDEYFKRNFYICSSGMYYEEPFKLCLHRFGSERILWATDYPYRVPDDVKAYLDAFDMTYEDKENIAHLNAEKLFGI